MSPTWSVTTIDAVAGLKSLSDASVDAVVADPPYPEIDRPYGRLNVSDWKWLMRGAVEEIRRVLRPKGSAVFIIQPNAEKVGKMRPWAFEFVAYIAREWNLVQDAYWWNTAAMPTVHCSQAFGLMRPSVKLCVWAGASDCYRDQSSVLWEPSEWTKIDRRVARAKIDYTPSGHHRRQGRMLESAKARGGSTPYNLLPTSNTDSDHSAGAKGHGAGTPFGVCSWWVRYLTQPGQIVLDPFCGSGTVGEASLVNGRSFVGFDSSPEMATIARKTCSLFDR